VTVFGFIAAKKAEHSISIMCRVLGVSRSGFHAWQARSPRRGRWRISALRLGSLRSTSASGVSTGPRASTPSSCSAMVSGSAQARGTLDAPGGHQRPGSAPARAHHDPRFRSQGARTSSTARSPPTAQIGSGSRNHLPQNLGGLALPGGRPGRLLAPDRRLVDGRSHAHRARPRRAGNGA
jgi:hypothetical protein